MKPNRGLWGAARGSRVIGGWAGDWGATLSAGQGLAALDLLVKGLGGICISRTLPRAMGKWASPTSWP